MAKTIFEINGREIGSFTRYAVPAGVRFAYSMADTVVVRDGDTVIHLSKAENCELCDRDREELPASTLLACTNTQVNKAFGYPARICVYCTYWIMVNLGNYSEDKVPSKIRQTMSRPKYMDKILPT